MPITDTNFIEQMTAKQNEKLAALMQQMDKAGRVHNKLAVVILAAGLGKRMKNPEKPKVMFELCGKPMIQYVVELALKIQAERIIPIVGHRRELVIDFLTDLLPSLPSPTEGGSDETPAGSEDVSNAVFNFAIQAEQLGTGHAVMQTEEYLSDFDGEVLILSGDVPLLKFETIQELVNEHFDNNNSATLLTTEFKNPFGYGRIVRDEHGNFDRIVEEKDCSDEQKKIQEINDAIYIVNSKLLFNALKQITPNNNQKEYYLTDIFHYIPKEKIGTLITEDELEVTGVNSVEQLQEMENILKSRNPKNCE
ncbi:MAG: UDP-N-acetylglucosamine pyrophosphorylase [Ignavibacteriae bacterium]|nr:MAG: UDP-N-acetylglucosamine pyrophosphorylase [Ignavibacteriota bacterium]